MATAIFSVKAGVLSEPLAIAAFIEAKAGSALRVGRETGPTTTWLWHELRALGLPVICIDARHAEAALSLQLKKSQRNDAVGLARIILAASWVIELLADARCNSKAFANIVSPTRNLEKNLPRLITIPQ